MPKMHRLLAIFLSGLVAAACNPTAAVDKADPEVVQGQKDLRAGKYGAEGQAAMQQMDKLQAMSPQDRAKYLREMNAANAGK